MATYIFQKISKEGQADGFEYGSEQSRDWYRDRAAQISQVNTSRLIQDKKRLYSVINSKDIGRMFMYFYDPKTKDKLPYYDRFPLIFMMERYADGFLGMNLHYIPPIFRARLMDALYSVTDNDRARESEKLRISYSILNSAARFRYFRPCVKRYLDSHVRSRFFYVPAEEWDIALMLPTERFKKSKKASVWKESKQSFGR